MAYKNENVHKYILNCDTEASGIRPQVIIDSWNKIINPSLCTPVDEVLQSFINTASEPDHISDEVLDRLSAVYFWLNKNTEPPEHEYIIIETEDSQEKRKNPHLKSISKLFILERITTGAPQPKSTTTNLKINSNHPNTESYQLLKSMEKGVLTPPSTSTPIYPPLSFLSPTHSLGDTLSLSTSESSQVMIDSFDKGDKSAAIDRFVGEGSITTKRQYVKGQNARQIKPNNLKLFELVILANVVHDFAPNYSLMGKNCFWFCNMMFDAIIEIFHLDELINLKDDERLKKFVPVPIDPHNCAISGRYLGWKVNHTDSEDLSKVIHEFKKACTFAISEVKI